MTSRRQVLGALAALTSVPVLPGCQQAAPAPEAGQPVSFTVADGTGYIFLNAPIAPQSRDLLLRNMDGLVNAGARTIRLAINSPGGQVDSAQAIVDDMNRLRDARGVTFETYAVGLVASAATYVFMNGQKRVARGGSGFLFHAAGLVSSGPVSAESLREEAAKIDVYERAVRALLKSRTRLDDSAIGVYLHRTVILSADDARRDGVVDEIGAFTVPPPARLITISARPPAGGARGPSASQPVSTR